MSHKSLSSWLSYIESQHPSEIDLGLDRGLVVLSRLDVSRPKKKVITVAGTNGKGSTCTLLTDYLCRIGERVGTYTSPHFLHFNERIQVDGTPVEDALLVEAFEAVEAARQGTTLTYFEFSTLAAIWVYSKLDLDYWVLEVGLGGRLDSVNMIDSDVAVITSIALDHTDWLGDSLDIIAQEKAGICRSGKPLINGMRGAPSNIRLVANEVGAQVFEKGVDFDFEVIDDHLTFSGFGKVFNALPKPQLPLENIATVIATLIKAGLDIDESLLRATVSETTLMGRFQQVAMSPDVYIDVAHNPEAANMLKAQLACFSHRPIAVCGMLKDKDIQSVINILRDEFSNWFCIDLETARGSKATQLCEMIGLNAKAHKDMSGALSDALALAKQESRAVVVFGSFVTVTEFMKLHSK